MNNKSKRVLLQISFVLMLLVALPILIITYAVLLYNMYLSFSTLVLTIWGDAVMGTVDIYSSRLNDSKSERNRARTVYKGYWSMANSKEYRGYVMYSSDETWPSQAAPQIRFCLKCGAPVVPDERFC